MANYLKNDWKRKRLEEKTITMKKIYYYQK